MRFLLRLALSIVSIVIVSAALIFYITWTSSVTMLTTLAKNNISEIGYHIMNKVDRFFFYRASDLQTIATDPILTSKNSSTQEIAQRLCEYRDLSKVYISLSFFDLDRVRVADTSGLGIGLKGTKYTHWDEVLQGKLSLGSDINISQTLGVPVIFFAALVKDKMDNTPLGIVILRMSMDKLYEIVGKISTKAEIQDNVYVDLVDKHGLLLFSNHNRSGILKENLINWESIQRAFSGEKDGFVEQHAHFGGEYITYFYSEQGYLDFPGNGWTLILHIPTKIILEPLANLRNKWLLVVIPTGFLILICIFAFAAQAAKPLNELRRAALELEKGNMDTKISIHTGDEIEELGKVFNQMVEAIKKNTEELLRAKAYTDGIVSSMLSTLIVFSTDGRIQRVNQATLDLLGYTEEELIGQDAHIILDEEPISRLRQLSNEGLGCQIELLYKTKNGKKIPMDFSGSLIRNKEEKRIGIVGVARDMRQTLALISDLKTSKAAIEEFSKTLETKVSERTKDLIESQEKLRESEFKFRKIFETAQDGILLIDAASGQILDANQFVLRLFQYTLPELLMKKFWEIGIPPKFLPIHQNEETIHKEGFTRYKELEVQTKDGWDIVIEIAHNTYEDQGRQIIQCIIHNITERKWMEERIRKLNENLQAQAEKLEIANQELKKTDQLKTDFLSMVSHELRTPLGIMKEGLSQVIEGLHGNLSPVQKELLSISLNNIVRLSSLINNLLDITKIEAGKIDLRRSPFDLVSLVKDVSFSFEPLMANKGITLKKTFQKEKIDVFADRDSIIQVVTNLLNNALKFTEKGSIEISVSAIETDGIAQCSVADSGAGLSKEDLPKVFDKFQQIGKNLKSSERGTGLGLSICKGIMDLHKGTIHVQSELGKGSTFTFTLPLYRGRERTQE